MALADTGSAPYAPLKGVTSLIEQARGKGFATPVTVSSITRLGIEASLARRTLATLKLLDLLDDEGELTPTMKAIKLAPTATFQATLADWLREAYKPIFAHVEPTDEAQKVADQFRYYEPQGQRNRMVSLFLGLCAYAGLIEKVPPMPRGGGNKAKAGPKGAKPDAAKEGKSKTQENLTSPTPKLGDARQRYVDMLLAKAAEQAEPDATLLDRIERALGIAASSEVSTS